MSGLAGHLSHRWMIVLGVALAFWLAIPGCQRQSQSQSQSQPQSVSSTQVEVVSLSKLDLRKLQQPRRMNRGRPGAAPSAISVAGQPFEDGVKTYGSSVLWIDLAKSAQRFTASVGIDDESKESTQTAVFRVFGDAKELFNSGPVKPGQPAKKVTVGLKGVQNLLLMVDVADSNAAPPRTDWAEAKIEYVAVQPKTMDGPAEKAVILTPKPSPKPRINGAKVFGVRPGNPFLFTVAATGDRPMTFAADRAAGGALARSEDRHDHRHPSRQQGEYVVTLRAKNAWAQPSGSSRSSAATQIALTPPMGWNSWNCFAGAVDDEKVKAAADAMVTQRPDQPRLDLHQHRRLLGDQARQQRSDAQGPSARRRRPHHAQQAVSRT